MIQLCFQYHIRYSYTSTTYVIIDELRIQINQNHGFTLPCEGYLHIKLEYRNSTGNHATIK